MTQRHAPSSATSPAPATAPSGHTPPLCLQRIGVTDAVFEHLKASIQSGEFRPGSPIPSERELQTRLGVSRLSLREGLARLSALGIIRVRHGKGAVVCDQVDSKALGNVLLPLASGKEWMHDLVEARSLLEGEMAALAAERRTKADLLRLEATLACDAADLSDAAAFAGRDLEFHREIARIASNAFLSLMHDAISQHIEVFLTRYAEASKDRRLAMERHRIILKAIQTGEPQEAREAARQHAHVCLDSILKHTRLLQRRCKSQEPGLRKPGFRRKS